jgi:hypothetical protein
MTPAARLWNVRRAWMSPWLNESQKAIASVLAVFTLRDFEQEGLPGHKAQADLRVREYGVA